ncbi:PKD domain-containing protein [Cellulomonas sp. ATA003]|uniref:PKD domain-containing protein n=1 Tax=Cellulomonas sp. ATA003 TaxID=3073064 RepID=UPI002872FEC6|nr:PKD domain-containing protein [Cellulomonas sp. ATA003]WNB85944.1 PKD domain-containing protein [Cellulomonas sp. ATA003]
MFTDDAEQVIDTTVLGIGVRIRATPQTFTWDFGDGSDPLRTDDPGRPWPEHTVAHRYRGEGTHRITLTTTWSAVFQIAGTTGWEPVAGTATTTSSSDPLTVHEARSHLVAGPTT